jgi:hypothetical protein
MLQNNMHRFLLGMFMCAINPVQTFLVWLGGTIFQKDIEPRKSHYNIYIIGIGLGTLG